MIPMVDRARFGQRQREDYSSDDDLDTEHGQRLSESRRSVDSKSICFVMLGAGIMTLLVALVVSLAAVPLGQEETRPFYYHKMSDPEALCNNGERASYYVRPALSGEHSNMWIIRFEGGNFCFDEDSCEARWDGHDHEFMLPKTDPITYQDPNGGILSDNEELNPFW